MKYWITLLVLMTGWAGAASAGCDPALVRLLANPYFHELEGYGAMEKNWHDPRDFREFRPSTGITTEHDAAGNITRARIRVLSDNPGSRVEVTGEFNDWGRKFPNVVLSVDPNDSVYHVGEIPDLKNGMQYRLIENGQPRIDPAAIQHVTPEWMDRFQPGKTPYLNSIFVDLDHPKFAPEGGVDMRGKVHRITEQALFNLIAKWPAWGRIGPPRKSETYGWMANSGLPEFIAASNNVVELMPQQGYVDGNEWYLQYQVFGRGPDSRFGTPEEFKAAVRAFHQQGVAVILDIVPSHYPYRGNGITRDLQDVGLHQWQSRWGRSTFGWVPSPWGTNRYDYQNPHVRRYLIDHTLTMMKHFDIDGIRVDNVDGIREQPGGYDFLRELNAEIRKYRPQAFITNESFQDFAPQIRRQDWQTGLGADSTNGGEFFWKVVAPHIRGRTEEINMEEVRANIRNPWNWKTQMQVRYITNHDESANPAGPMSGDFPAEKLKGGGDYYTHRKLQVWSALGALASAHSMDMLQVQLGQEGNMNNNPNVDYGLMNRYPNRQTRELFVRLHQVTKDNPAFAAENLEPNIENHVDYDNKVISLVRTDFKTGKKYYAILNLGHKQIDGYRVGVNADGNFRVLVDNSARMFGGNGSFEDKLPSGVFHSDAQGAHSKSNSLILPTLAPYHVLLLEQE